MNETRLLPMAAKAFSESATILRSHRRTEQVVLEPKHCNESLKICFGYSRVAESVFDTVQTCQGQRRTLAASIGLHVFFV